MAKKKKKTPRRAPVVAVINMKGGVGKTTISGNLFREVFRRHGVRTLLVDFDAQFNLTQLLLTRKSYESFRRRGKTIGYVMEPEPSDSVFSISTSDTVDIGSVDDYTTQLKYLSNNKKIDLRLIPGDFRLAVFNLRDDPKSLRLTQKRFKDLMKKARGDYGLVVLDCNPSSSFLTRCALECSTHVLIPVRPDKYSILGVEMIQQYIDLLPSLTNLPSTTIVLNDVTTTTEARRIIGEIRSHPDFGPSVLAHTIPRSGVLAARSDYSGFAVDRRVSYRKWITARLASVADEFAVRIGLTS